MNVNGEMQKNSKLSLCDRHTLSLDGVCDVVSFDETAVLLKTTLGALTVEGRGLHIRTLDLATGTVAIEGEVSAIFYTDKPAGGKGGFFARLVH